MTSLYALDELAVISKTCVFVGYDRARDPRQRLERTRKHLALLLEMPYAEFSKQFGWANLYGDDAAPDKGNSLEDARRARLLIDEILGDYERAVLLGNDVAAAFGCDDRPRYAWAPLEVGDDLFVARIPHTSLRNWTNPERWGQGRGPWAAEAQEFMRDLRRLAAAGGGSSGAPGSQAS